MVADDWMGLWFVFGLIVLVTVVAVVVIWQVAATRRAKAAADTADAYRRLAEQVAAVQRETSQQLAEIRQSLTALQQILKDVE